MQDTRRRQLFYLQELLINCLQIISITRAVVNLNIHLQGVLLEGKNKHVTEGHLTLFVNTFPNFSQSISNNHDFFFMVHRLYHKLLIS